MYLQIKPKFDLKVELERWQHLTQKCSLNVPLTLPNQCAKFNNFLTDVSMGCHRHARQKKKKKKKKISGVLTPNNNNQCIFFFPLVNVLIFSGIRTCASIIFCLESTMACMSVWSFFSSSSTDINLQQKKKTILALIIHLFIHTQTYSISQILWTLFQNMGSMFCSINLLWLYRVHK